MNEKEKKAIEKLKQTTQQCHNSKECWENESCPDCYVEVEDILAIDTILNLIDKQNKVIDEMARMINSYDIDEDLCRQTGTNPTCNDFEDPEMCINCIKQYFIRKVEEDDNRTSQ